jgi:hypothetical protein
MGGRISVHGEGRRGGPPVTSGNLIQSVGQEISERLRFAISELKC